MVDSSKDHQDEFEDDEEATPKGRLDGKVREKNRSKHSETEQRRRSKINERFQILRDLIPQNDQKRDKASFLLEVIEYVQYLQEKVNMYEGSYPGWSAQPSKLIPWRNQNVSAESLADQCQVTNNGSHVQNVSPPILPNPQNSLESDLVHGLATQAVPLNMQPQNIFDPIGSGGVPMQPLQESVSDAPNMDSQAQGQAELWQAGSSTACSVLNNTSSIQEGKSGAVSSSSSYSQGILDTLTQVLRSSGMDLSQTSISVEFDVGSQADSGLTSMASNSKDHVKQPSSNQLTSTGDHHFEQAHKRQRTEHN
ncbi:hypothetical protein UlMin_014512 [Ulmus minor]